MEVVIISMDGEGTIDIALTEFRGTTFLFLFVLFFFVSYYLFSDFRSSSKEKGGNGAALSALTLLAFLFLINVMQQSLQDNNSTTTSTATAVLLRNTELPIILDNKENKNAKTKNEFSRVTSTYDSRITTQDRVQHEN